MDYFEYLYGSINDEIESEREKRDYEPARLKKDVYEDFFKLLPHPACIVNLSDLRITDFNHFFEDIVCRIGKDEKVLLSDLDAYFKGDLELLCKTIKENKPFDLYLETVYSEPAYLLKPEILKISGIYSAVIFVVQGKNRGYADTPVYYNRSMDDSVERRRVSESLDSIETLIYKLKDLKIYENDIADAGNAALKATFSHLRHLYHKNILTLRDAGLLYADMQKHDLPSLLSDFCKMVKKFTGIEIKITEMPPVAEVYCDHEKILKIFLNFVSNAALYSSDRNNIKASLKREGKYYKVSVLSSGEIKEEIMPYITEKFRHLKDFGYDIYFGTSGYGLYISSIYAKMHGGDINIESKDNIVTASFRILADQPKPRSLPTYDNSGDLEFTAEAELSII